MNNKGFAVTTLLYGLTIIGILLIGTIMASVATTRNNMREISDKVEEDLLNFIKTDNIYTVPGDYSIPITEPGFYRIEAWGPQDSSGGGVCNGTKGSYATGIIRISSGTNLNFKIGNCGEETAVYDSTNKHLMYVSSDKSKDYVHGQSERTDVNQADPTVQKNKFFIDGYRITNTHTGKGKIKIKQISTKTNYIDLQKNDLWKNVIKVQIKNAESCTATISYLTGNNALKTINGKQINNNDTTLELNSSKGANSIVINCNTPPSKNIIIYLKKSSSFTMIYNGLYSFPETGIQLSAYQPLSSAFTAFPKEGNYYIIPLKQYNKVITATSPDLNFSPIEIRELDGSNSQRWSIEESKYTTGQYKIVETSTFRALDIQDDENYLNEKITAKKTFNAISKVDSQHWIILPNNDGTYSIKTILPKKLEENTGYITTETDKENEMGIGIIGTNPTDAEKFVIYSLDLSIFSN